MTEKTTDAKLLPCPFCGSKLIKQTEFGIRCGNCGATAVTIGNWNERHQYVHAGWIPVGERLPERAGQYLTAVKPVLEDESFVKVQTFVPPAHPGFSGWRVARVTHWMPFPDAPASIKKEKP